MQNDFLHMFRVAVQQMPLSFSPHSHQAKRLNYIFRASNNKSQTKK